MACKIPYIEDRISNSKLAQELTNKTINIWESIKDSKLFRKERGIYVVELPGTVERQLQDRFISKVNQSNPILYTDSQQFNEGIIQIIDDKVNVNVLKDIYETNQAVEFIKSVSPNSDIQIQKDLIDNLGKGSYDTLTKVITLSQSADKKTGKHEVFHKAFDAENKEKQNQLLEEGSKQFGIKRGVSTATVKYQKADQEKINYVLKAIDILQSEKTIQLFKTLEKNKVIGDVFWKKLQDLQIPSSQIELMKNLKTTNRENLIVGLGSLYTYETKIQIPNTADYYSFSSLDNRYYIYNDSENMSGYILIKPNDSERHKISKEEYDNAFFNRVEKKIYPTLIVPGGDKYEELNINTPLITPAKKGHAEFASDKGIGWYRSDKRNNTNTRRLLELQSDLFQDKYRKKFTDSGIQLFEDGTGKKIIVDATDNDFLKLLKKDNNWVTFFVNSFIQDSTKKGFDKVLFPTDNTIYKIENLPFKNNPENEKFLKELDIENYRLHSLSELRHSKWLTYNKINELIENFKILNKSSKESNLKEIKKILELSGDINKDLILSENFDDQYFILLPKIINYIKEIVNQNGEISIKIKEIESSIKTLKENNLIPTVIKNTQFKSTYDFYEETIKNILIKQYGNDKVNKITDEHGNTWYELKLDKDVTDKVSTIRLQALNVNYTGDLAIEEKMAEMMENTADEDLPKTLLGKWIQDVRNFFRNLFKEKDKISQYLRDVNQGKIKDFKSKESKTVYQLWNSNSVPQSNNELVDKLQKFIAQKYPEFNVKFIKDLGTNGLIDFGRRLVLINQNVPTALSEEACHLVIELHPNKKIFTDLVRDTKLYGIVFNDYKNLEQYQINGKVNIELIKSEAVAKLMAEAIYASNTGDWSQFDKWIAGDKKSLLQRIKQALLEFFGFIQKDGFQVFRDIGEKINKNDFREITRTNQIESNEILLQYTPRQEKSVFDMFEKMYNERTDLGDTKGTQLLKKIQGGFNIMKDNVNRLKQENSSGQFEFSRDTFKTIEQKIKDGIDAEKAGNLEGRETNFKKAASNFISTLDSISNFSKYIKDNIGTIDLKHATDILRFSSQWTTYLQDLEQNTEIDGELKDFINEVYQNLSLLKKEVDNKLLGFTVTDIKKILNESTEFIVKEALKRLVDRNPKWANHKLIEYLSIKSIKDWNKQVKNPIGEIGNSIKEIGNLTQRDLVDVNTILSNTFTDKRVESFLMGQQADTSIVSRLFLGSSSSADPIIASFQKMIDTARLEGSKIAREIYREFYDVVNPLINETKLSHLEIGHRLTVKTKTIVKEDGTEELKDTYSYLTDIKQEAYADKEMKLKELSKLGYGTEEYKKVEIEYKKWERDNFYTDYKPIFYELIKEDTEIGRLAKKAAGDIWEDVRRIQAEIESMPYFIAENPNPQRIELEGQIDQLYVDYKRLYSKFRNGVMLDPNDNLYKISEYLQSKVKDLKLFTYKENPNAFVNGFRKFIQSIEMELGSSSELFVKGKKTFDKILKLLEEPDYIEKGNLIKASDLLDSMSNQDSIVVKWWHRNTRVQYSKDYWEEKALIMNQINDIVTQLNQLKGIVRKSNTDEWNNILGIVKQYKDIDNVIDGTQLKEEEQKVIQKLQDEMEQAKEIKDVPDNKKAEALRLNKQLKSLFEELSEVQEIKTTDYYQEKLEEFNLVDNDYIGMTLEEVKEHIRNQNINDNDLGDEGIKWFENNHYQKKFKGFDGKENTKWSSTYAWTERKPIKEEDIVITPGSRYMLKVVSNDYKEDVSHLDMYNRWKPRERNLSTNELTGYINEDYFKLKNSKDSKDIALYKILSNLVRLHKESQDDNHHKLYFTIPQEHRKLLEDPKKTLSNIKDRATNQIQETLGSNFKAEKDETVGEREVARKDNFGLLGKFFSKEVLRESRDFQGDRTFKVALKYYNHVDIEHQSRNVLTSEVDFLEASEVHQAFNKLSPNVIALHKVLKKYNAGVQRTEQVENMADREIGGINKHYEVGKDADKVIGALKWIANIRSQSIFNPKGALKNLLAGNANNYLHKSLISDASYWAASKRFLGNWLPLKSMMMGKSAKSHDFYIYEFFMPRIGENAKYYMTDTGHKILENSSWFMGAMEVGEEKIFGTALELYLENPYEAEVTEEGKIFIKKGKIRDFLKTEGGILTLQGDPGHILDNMKFQVAEIQRIIQGNQGHQKVSTEANRFTIGSAVMFFRNYLANNIVNRFGTKQTNYYLNRETEGYYRTTYKVFKELGQDLKNITKNWATLTPLEQQNVYKVLKELSFIVGTILVLWALGYADWDKDRFKKLKKNSYLHNIAIYELLTTYNEVAGLSPSRLTGFVQEGASNITKSSMAFGEISKLATVTNDALAIITGEAFGNDMGRVKVKNAFANKGDVKLVGDIKKLLGWNNFTGIWSNEKLVEQTRQYVTITERN